MKDQAENLRKAIENLGTRLTGPDPVMPVNPAPEKRVRQGPARVFAVTSGKGGVGKTSLSANLALALRGMGYMVAIIDADIGLSNVEVLFGLFPKYKLSDIFDGEKTIRDILCDGPLGVKFISGGSGFEEIARLDEAQLSALLSGFSELDEDFDVIIIDTGAGMSETVLSMALAADDILLVTTPEPTSVTDAYALIKALAARDRDKLLRLVVNRADSELEANEIMSKLTQVSDRFLDLKLHKLGYILNDPLVVKSVKQQQPFLVGFPQSRTSRSVREIASRLMEPAAEPAAGGGRGLSGFLGGITRLLNIQFK